jgi:hypothetical protein
MAKEETSDVIELAQVRTDKLIAELEERLQRVAEMLESEFGQEKLAS